jgi:hypothetical protein
VAKDEGAVLALLAKRDTWPGSPSYLRALPEDRGAIASARHFYIGNPDLVDPDLVDPDLVERFRNGWPRNEPDRATYYRGGARAYAGYPIPGTSAPHNSERLYERE